TLRAGDEYMVQIPGEGIRGRTLEYYLKAWDAAGNTALQGGPGLPIVVAIRTPSKEEPLLATAPPTEATQPWYQKWWVWPLVGALIGGAIMALQDRGGEEGKPSTGSVTIIAPEP
ncbi:MAG TPA: hypothetical protein VJK28_01140, partial [Nitrospiria bacterium]|nr:hypothetical protein [Nitrospiria bacterium]